MGKYKYTYTVCDEWYPMLVIARDSQRHGVRTPTGDAIEEELGERLFQKQQEAYRLLHEIKEELLGGQESSAFDPLLEITEEGWIA